MSDRFRIHKNDDGSWHLEYPDGFDDLSGGEDCATFNIAIAAFREAADRQCPMCDKGAVVDTDYGWECRACGSRDVGFGCDLARAVTE